MSRKEQGGVSDAILRAVLTERLRKKMEIPKLVREIEKIARAAKVEADPLIIKSFDNAFRDLNKEVKEELEKIKKSHQARSKGAKRAHEKRRKKQKPEKVFKKKPGRKPRKSEKENIPT